MNTKTVWIVTLIAIISLSTSKSAVLKANDQNLDSITQLRVTTRRTTSRNPIPPITIPPQTTSTTLLPVFTTTQNYTTTVNYTTKNSSNDYINIITTPRMPSDGARRLMNEFHFVMCLMFIIVLKFV